MAGFSGEGGRIVYLEADACGRVLEADLDRQIETYGERIAGIMVTNPNTSGIFETDFKSIAEKVHAVGGLVYMDGANMNAIAGWVDLGALGVDAVHNNLHKTWTIPHGGGGLSDAIVAVSHRLESYLRVTKSSSCRIRVLLRLSRLSQSVPFIGTGVTLPISPLLYLLAAPRPRGRPTDVGHASSALGTHSRG